MLKGFTRLRPRILHGMLGNVGALTIRIGFGGILQYSYNKEAPKP